MTAQNQSLLRSDDNDKWSPSRQSVDTLSDPDDVEGLLEKPPRSRPWYSRAKRRIETWGFALAIIGVLAFSSSIVIALRSSRKSPAYGSPKDISEPNENGEPTLYNGQYPIQHDPIGAYITCPTNSPEAARQAGCMFDVLFHGYIPDPCFDHDLHQYWARDRYDDLEFREDEEARVIATSEILRGDTTKYPTVWAPTKTHYNHCLYLINGTSRAQARESALVLDTHLDEWHMQHCFDILTNTPAYFPATFMFTYQHRCYIRNLSHIDEKAGAWIRELKAQAEKLFQAK